MRLTACLLALFLQGPLLAEGESGADRFEFSGWAGPPVPVFITVPSPLRADLPVVFVMHGVQRNAEDYRDQWHSLALENGFVTVVPEFSQANFPGAAAYNFGNVFDADGAPVDESLWSFSAIEAIFRELKVRYGLNATGFALYGHSAGAQFVHRYLMWVPEAPVERIVAANAGWYTLPDRTIPYPYGLQDSGVTPGQLALALQLPVTILLGDRDTDPNHKSLRRTDEADAQGAHRLARGFTFYESARLAAEELEVPFNWHLSTVQGANHDNTLMAPAAVIYLLKAPDSPPAVR